MVESGKETQKKADNKTGATTGLLDEYLAIQALGEVAWITKSPIDLGERSVVAWSEQFTR